MFSECSGLKFLNLTSFYTNEVTNMSNMFNKCSRLKKLNISSSFYTNKVTNMSSLYQKLWNKRIKFVII